MAVAAVGCSAAGTGGGLDVEVVDDLDARVEAAAESAEAGGVVARVDAPAGHHTVAVGPADVRGDHRLSGDEAFRVGSITKVFTAKVAMQLVEDGAIDLDDPVAAVVPERVALFEHSAEVTLRQLLSHAVGLPGDVAPEYFRDAWDLGYINADDGVATVARADVERHDWWDYVAEDPRHELAGGFHPPHIDDLPGQDDVPFDVTMSHATPGRPAGWCPPLRTCRCSRARFSAVSCSATARS